MSGTPNAEAEGVVVSKVQVKKEIKTIVENLENILGDLKDVAKELKEVKCQETRCVDLSCFLFFLNMMLSICLVCEKMGD